MNYLETTHILSDAGAMQMLNAALAKANEIGQPQCIVIVDASGVTLVEFRMMGAKYLSLKSARSKARTAASIGAASDQIPEHVRSALGLATEGDVTGLSGGLPITVNDKIIGAIGVGSGSPDQDITVAQAALAALEG